MSQGENLSASIDTPLSVREIAAMADFRNCERHAGLTGLSHLENRFRETPSAAKPERCALPAPLASNSLPRTAAGQACG